MAPVATRPASVAAAAMLAAAIPAGAASAGRTPVPGGQGCYAVTDRSACCLFVDGREGDDAFDGQECVPSKQGVFFDVGAPDAEPVCQPACWVRGTCGDGTDQSEIAAVCPADPEAALAAVVAGGGRMAVPGGRGCNEVTDRTACCAFVDGRTEAPYAGRECVPARENTFFDVGNGRGDTVCQPSCWATGTCGGTGTSMFAHAGFCAAPPVGFLPPQALVTQANRRCVRPGSHCVDYEVLEARWLPQPVLASPEIAPEEAGARIAPGGDIRFYVIGSSNAAWQTWPDQMHASLKRLGYNVRLPRTDIPGEAPGPIGRRTAKCADAASYETLTTPRLGLQGWSSWGFAYEDEDDCDADGMRSIAGWRVNCTNGWACTPKWRGDVPFVPVSTIAKGVRGANVVVLANFVNDGRNAMMGPHECFGPGPVPDYLQSTDITADSLRRTIRAIHAEDPDVMVFVLARYADHSQVIFVNEHTLERTAAINNAVKEKIQDEPNTHFVDVKFPLDVNMFQTLNAGHANCRGDLVLSNTVIEAMYQHGVISTGLDLGDEDTCLARSDCGNLDLACCQRSALCYVTSAGACEPYGPGLQ